MGDMETTTTKTMEGILRCSRYSFGPNRLHYCGPDANNELRGLIENGKSNFGLELLLRQFKTLYPYLKYIAEENRIRDPFDARVVEAYWLGNELLERIQKRKLHDFLIDSLHVKDRFNHKEFAWLREKIDQGALPHHSFHVLNIWQQEGHNDALENLIRMDECRVSSGVVLSTEGPKITVKTEPLVYTKGKFVLGEPVQKILIRRLESEYDIEQIKPGQIVSIHWSVPCEIITPKQEAALRKFTQKSIAFANLTI